MEAWVIGPGKSNQTDGFQFGFLGQEMAKYDIVIDIECQNDMISNFAQQVNVLIKFGYF